MQGFPFAQTGTNIHFLCAQKGQVEIRKTKLSRELGNMDDRQVPSLKRETLLIPGKCGQVRRAVDVQGWQTLQVSP